MSYDLSRIFCVFRGLFEYHGGTLLLTGGERVARERADRM